MCLISQLKYCKAETATQDQCAAVRQCPLCERPCWRNKVYLLRTVSVNVYSLLWLVCALGNRGESIRIRTYQRLVLITDTTVWLKINLKLYQPEWLRKNIYQAWLRQLKSAGSFVFDLKWTLLQPMVHILLRLSNIFSLTPWVFFLNHVICLLVQVVVIR